MAELVKEWANGAADHLCCHFSARGERGLARGERRVLRAACGVFRGLQGSEGRGGASGGPGSGVACGLLEKVGDSRGERGLSGNRTAGPGLLRRSLGLGLGGTNRCCARFCHLGGWVLLFALRY